MKKQFMTSMATLAIFLLIAQSMQAHPHKWGRGDNRDRIKGSGDLVSETRKVEDFTEIETNGSLDIYVTVGGPTELKLTIDDNIIEHVVTEVRHGVLEIYFERRFSYSMRSRSRVDIVVPTLESFESSGSGDVEINRVKTDVFTYDISGSGDLFIDGDVDEFRVRVSGSGDIDAKGLKAKEANVRISGSGDVKVYASESIYGRISGSGDIEYYGNPDIKRNRVSGSGSIRKRR